MIFIKKKLKSKTYKRSYAKKKYRKKKKNSGSLILKIVLFLILSFILATLVSGLVLYKKYIEPLPPVESLKDMEIAEASTIYDKDGKELYRIFKENRKYVNFNQINKNMINAIVAGEDKRFWENPGFDLVGLSRAVIYRFIGKSDKFEGTSTLSQQLMKVVYLSNERKLERKIKELYLSYKLNEVFSKEKILELYLNKIEFGSNAFGIEQASLTFFGKSSGELTVLESSILASLPKGPSYYSPYSHPDRLLGYLYIYVEGKNEELKKILTDSDIALYSKEVGLLTDFIKGLKFIDVGDRVLSCGIDKTKVKSNIRVDNDGCSLMDYSELLTFLNSIKIVDGANVIEYQTGRKDFILGRMLEDGYVDFEGYKSALLNSIGFKFKAYSEDITYPYFVMYVKEFLEKKYGKEVIEKGGLKIYTTINSDFQDKAEEIVIAQAEKNELNYDAKNAALISIDNKSGAIVSMVGGRDYFDTENGGNNNMVTSRLQPGSTFKPFVYALAILEETIGTKTPVYDLETKFPNYTPANFDGEFMGKMNISTALNYSRNIPAIKMFYLAGGENKIIHFMEKLGVTTLFDFKKEYMEKYSREYSYGASMALGTGLMTPLELAASYSVFANMGEEVYINPILKIVDSHGNIIEDNTENKNIEKKQLISKDLAYIINTLLSDTSSRPEFWNTYLSLDGRQVAAKTGTSTKQKGTGKNKIIYPRNLWTIGYTPQYTTVAWAGNTNGKELGFKGNGLEGAGPIWHDFMEYIHTDLEAETWKRTSGVKEVSISEVSGLLPSPDGFPVDFIEKSLFINSPSSYDNSLKLIKVDSLCNGKVDSKTPISAIKEGYVLNFHSLYPDNPSWEGPVRKWVQDGEYKEKYGSFSNIITNYNDELCDRIGPGTTYITSNYESGDIVFVGNNYVEVAAKSDKPISKIQVILDDIVLKEVYAGNSNKLGKSIEFNIANSYKDTSKDFIIRAIDNEFYFKDYKVNLNILGKDIIAPSININNSKSISLVKGEKLNITGYVDDSSKIRSINFYLDSTNLLIGSKDRHFSYELDTSSLATGNYIFKIESYDWNFNRSEEIIEIKIKD